MRGRNKYVGVEEPARVSFYLDTLISQRVGNLWDIEGKKSAKWRKCNWKYHRYFQFREKREKVVHNHDHNYHKVSHCRWGSVPLRPRLTKRQLREKWDAHLAARQAEQAEDKARAEKLARAAQIHKEGRCKSKRCWVCQQHLEAWRRESLRLILRWSWTQAQIDYYYPRIDKVRV